jgi:HpcH/HpaI aldolase/citrate lyase family
VATRRTPGESSYCTTWNTMVSASRHLRCCARRSLDVGVRGVMVLMVESQAQAEAIAEATRYPPQGRRGAAFGFTHDDYQSGNVLDTMLAATAATPAPRLAVETMPSLAPSTAALNHLLRATRWFSGSWRRRLILHPVSQIRPSSIRITTMIKMVLRIPTPPCP